MTTPPLFRRLPPWLRATFGRDVHRVALDAGSSCPNRDGTKGRGGCSYCDVEGSGTGALRDGVALAEQLEAGIQRVRKRGPDVGVIAYFQSYTNTYVSPERLEEMLAIVRPRFGEPVVALSLSTRPDCLPEWALDALAECARQVPVWLELGLEAASDEVLRDCNRLHTVADFRTAVARARARGLLTIGHAILGLPGDGREGARRTARELCLSAVEGVKVHNLMVLARTQLAGLWRKGELAVPSLPEYVSWLADFVERLAPGQILHRIGADAPAGQRLAPDWEVGKDVLGALLEQELGRRGSCQGALSESIGSAPTEAGMGLIS